MERWRGVFVCQQPDVYTDSDFMVYGVKPFFHNNKHREPAWD